jgi:hypothetical protein
MPPPFGWHIFKLSLEYKPPTPPFIMWKVWNKKGKKSVHCFIMQKKYCKYFYRMFETDSIEGSFQMQNWSIESGIYSNAKFWYLNIRHPKRRFLLFIFSTPSFRSITDKNYENSQTTDTHFAHMHTTFLPHCSSSFGHDAQVWISQHLSDPIVELKFGRLKHDFLEFILAIFCPSTWVNNYVNCYVGYSATRNHIFRQKNSWKYTYSNRSIKCMISIKFARF